MLNQLKYNGKGPEYRFERERAHCMLKTFTSTCPILSARYKQKSNKKWTSDQKLKLHKANLFVSNSNSTKIAYLYPSNYINFHDHRKILFPYFLHFLIEMISRHFSYRKVITLFKSDYKHLHAQSN